jgi:hypothetical protein
VGKADWSGHGSRGPAGAVGVDAGLGSGLEMRALEANVSDSEGVGVVGWAAAAEDCVAAGEEAAGAEEKGFKGRDGVLLVENGFVEAEAGVGGGLTPNRDSPRLIFGGAGGQGLSACCCCCCC